MFLKLKLRILKYQGIKMTFTIRKAKLEDRQQIIALKSTVWPQESASNRDVSAVLDHPTHQVFIAEENNRLTGFVDGFTTIDASGRHRWEVDLLAVHPEHRRKGVAQALVTACTQLTHDYPSDYARALIALNNPGSKKTFQSCAYECIDPVHELLVTGFKKEIYYELATHFFPVAVQTLSYHGFWLEMNPSKLETSQKLPEKSLKDAVLGVVLDKGEKQMAVKLREMGFNLVGQYQWWIRNLQK
jgi:ribosomal protein S18 acetylase RimI-like enzyme